MSSGERIYTCLVCADRPIFTNKASAYGHARCDHRGLLEDHHVDELFEVHDGVRIPVDYDEGPYYCLDSGDCTRRVWNTEDAMCRHVSTQHDVFLNHVKRGVHYATETEVLRMKTEREREHDRQARNFGVRLSSIRGVADFLTEAGDLPDEEAA